jgi:hypothetical protein
MNTPYILIQHVYWYNIYIQQYKLSHEYPIYIYTYHSMGYSMLRRCHFDNDFVAPAGRSHLYCLAAARPLTQACKKKHILQYTNNISFHTWNVSKLSWKWEAPALLILERDGKAGLIHGWFFTPFKVTWSNVTWPLKRSPGTGGNQHLPEAEPTRGGDSDMTT